MGGGFGKVQISQNLLATSILLSPPSPLPPPPPPPPPPSPEEVDYPNFDLHEHLGSVS